MSVTKPALTVVGTNGQNLWVGQGLPQKIALVAHVMQGTLSGCDSWFANPAAQASSNYGVGKDGSIHQYVDPQGKDAPFANGIAREPAATFRALQAMLPGVNPNWWSVSIEHEGMSGEPLTSAQLAASGHLTAWLCETFSIPADEAHLLGHNEIDAVTRSGCPGWDRAGWLAWEAAINGYLAPVVPVPPPLVLPALDDAARLQGCGYLAGGSSVKDMIAWLSGFRD